MNNFWKPVKIKQKNFGFIPRIKPVKHISKKNLTYPEAIIRYPKLKPFGDADKDGVKNWLDCKPFDRKRHGWIAGLGWRATSKEKSEARKKLRNAEIEIPSRIIRRVIGWRPTRIDDVIKGKRMTYEIEQEKKRIALGGKIITEKERIYKKGYMKEYSQRPEVKEKQKEYFKRPEVKEKQKGYMKEYSQRPEVKEKQKGYMKKYKQKLKLRVIESDYDKDRRLRAGYTNIKEVPARELKEKFEKLRGEDLAWNKERLKAAREREEVSEYPRVSSSGDIEDGRHRIAVAAEKNELIDVAEYYEPTAEELINEEYKDD